VRVRVVHERLDRRRVRRVEDHGGADPVERDRVGRDRGERLDVGRVAAGGADEGVLAHGRGVQELLGARTAHQAVVGGDDDVLQPELLEDPLVRVALRLVRGILALVGVVERVRVLHRELAPAQQAGARTGLVAVLVLDLIDRQRQVLVRRVEVLHEKREHLLVRRRQQVVGAPAVLQPEDAVAVGGPAAGRLVRLPRQQRREVHLVGAGAGHLLADDRLDPRLDLQAQRQPREDAGRGTPDVAGAHEQPVARDLGVGGVFTERAEEVVRQTGDHEGQVYDERMPRPRVTGA
jgi:hypothetical protein